MKSQSLILVFMTILMASFAYASNCVFPISVNEDCNVMIQVSDSNGNAVTDATCKFSLYDPNYSAILTDEGMIHWVGGKYYFRTDSNFNSEGAWVVTTFCEGQRDENYTGSVTLQVVDVNLTYRIKKIDQNAADYNYNLPTNIWQNQTRDLTDYNHSTLPEYIWSASSRTLTDYSGVWSVASRTLTDYNQNDLFEYIWDLNENVNIDLNADLYAQGLTASDVWTYTTRELTTKDINAYSVWNYVTRTLTDYNMATLPDYVWVASARALTDYNQIAMFDYLRDLNSNINTDLNVDLYAVGATASDIWAYTTRTLTDYNMNSLPSYIWNITPRTLTDYNQGMLFRYVSDLNDNVNVDLNSDLYLAGATPSDIWTYATRELTDYNMNNLPDYIWNAAARTLTDYSGVWAVASRTLTDYNQTELFKYVWDLNSNVNIDLNADLYSAGATASDIWTYGTRELTDYNQVLMYRYLDDINSTGGALTAEQDAILRGIDLNLADVNAWLTSWVDEQTAGALTSDQNAILWDLNSTISDRVWEKMINTETPSDYNALETLRQVYLILIGR